jgi:predicted MFS family arabinose efflux permease
MIPAALLLAKRKPESVGADGISSDSPDTGSILKDKEKVPAPNPGWTLKNLFRMPVFWLIALLYPFYVFGHTSMFQHGYSLFIDKGISAVTAGTMMSILGLVSMSGKIALGYLSDRIPVRYIMMIALAIGAASIFLLFLNEANLGAWLFVLTWGFWECGIIALQPVMVANTFDKAVIGKMLGIFTLFTVFPQFIGPAFMGYVFDITGNYNLALFVIAAFYLISLAMAFFTGFARRSPAKEMLVGN